MAFFLRIAQRRDGVDKLVDNKLIDNLLDFKALDLRPEDISSADEFETFIPSANELYHQCLMPALQVLLCILSHVGVQNVAIIHKVGDRRPPSSIFLNGLIPFLILLYLDF